MAFLRSRSCNLTLMGSISHILCRYPIPLLSHNSPLAARALIRHYNTPYSHEPEKLTNFGIEVVPQQKAYVIERFGKYRKTLFGGLHFLLPVLDRVAYVHSILEKVFSIPNQTVVTNDDVLFTIDVLVSLRIVDPYLASYEAENPILMVRQLAQMALRSEVGKMELLTMFNEMEKVNKKIASVINEAAAGWGVKCTQCEIMDITPPIGVLEAERRRDAKILEAEGGARGDLHRARVTAAGLNIVSDDMKASGVPEAASLTVAEQCGVAKEAVAGNKGVAPRRWSEFGFHDNSGIHIRDP